MSLGIRNLTLVCLFLLQQPLSVQSAQSTAPVPPASRPSSSTVDIAVLRSWIEQMKTAPRGPFERIRWFCQDGAVLPPTPGACRERGGGVQHGEWNSRTRTIRQQGYLIASLLAEIRPLDYVGPNAQLDALRQLLLEQFLIAYDDGWVFREARYYRGAIQVEDERMGARHLLMALAEDAGWRGPQRFLLLREAARLLPVSTEPPTAELVRKLAIEIADADPGFQPLRVKLHGIPDAKDAQRVRDYAAKRGKPALAAQYQRLISELTTLYSPQTALRQLEELIRDVRDAQLKNQLREALTTLRKAGTLPARLETSAELAAGWRRQIEAPEGLHPLNRLRLLLASLILEQEMYAVGNQLLENAAKVDRASQLSYLRTMLTSLYAVGLVSERQWQAAQQPLDSLLAQPRTTLDDYYSSLRYLGRVTSWAQRSLEFHFAPTVERWDNLTPLATHFIPDRLRASPLLAYTRVLDELTGDANRLVGVSHRLFGREQAQGLRALNPGLRRGTLLLPPDDPAAFRRDGIYILPSTTPELPPVAGIMTRGEGSSLSHVQLLARNLGIPNLVLDDALLPLLEQHVGQKVVLAVSPHGAVEIDLDGPRWDAVFGREQLAEDVVIEPDLVKLDLNDRQLYSLAELQASDSGRIIGPKAANLAQLRRHYPEAVNPGLAIPFGVFRAFLAQPFDAKQPQGPSAWDWLTAEYSRLQGIAAEATRQAETARFLAQLRNWIESTEIDPDLRERLRAAMQEQFGNSDTVGVFVRSDTNVEDLPGFTGAGLNLTVPNVVGFEAVLQAIRKVWASPFTERAYAWRQAHMREPQHVYPAVLLLQTFASDKSGVMVTADVESGDRHWLSIASSEGVGGAVEGQAAEELRVHRDTGKVRLLAQATAPWRMQPLATGGLERVPASGRAQLLTAAEIERLRLLADEVEQRFPMPADATGLPAPADIEFGFRDGQLALFQIRPFVDSARARRSLYLMGMDQRPPDLLKQPVDLQQPPASTPHVSAVPPAAR